MKKNLFLIAITSIGLMACGGKQQPAENLDAAADTTVVEEAIIEETVSPDYVMLNLKGKVKSYELSSADDGNYWDFVGGKVEFDENGLIIKVNDQKAKLERNDKGQITKYTWKEQMEEDYWEDANYMYSYDEKGQVTEIEYHGCYADYNSTFERNENGDVIKRINKSLTQGNETNKYQYTEFDEHGNWTKCISNGTIIRKITYWE